MREEGFVESLQTAVNVAARMFLMLALGCLPRVLFLVVPRWRFLRPAALLGKIKGKTAPC